MARPIAFGTALASLVLIVGGVGVDVWMAALPSIGVSCGTGCTQYHTDPRDQRWVGAVIVAIGVVILLVAWRLDHHPAARPRQGWKPFWSWGSPLVWLAVIPLIGGPATFLMASNEANDSWCQVSRGYFGGGSAVCPTSVFLPSVVLPGLLNLVPIWWLRKAGPRVQIAALVASLLGIAGLVASVLVLYSFGPTVSWDFGFLLPDPPPHQAADFGLGLIFWLAAIIALLVIAKLRLPAEGVPSPGLNSRSAG